MKNHSRFLIITFLFTFFLTGCSVKNSSQTLKEFEKSIALNCEKIQDPLQKDNCYSDSAVKYNMTYLCNKVQSEVIKSNCYGLTYQYTVNLSVCELARPYVDVVACFAHVAASTKDISVCEKLSGKDKLSEFDMKDRCIVIASKSWSDISICDRIGNIQLKDRCIVTIAITKKDTSMCILASSQYVSSYQDSCFIEIVKASGDIKLCNDLPDNQKDDCIEKLARIKKDDLKCKDLIGTQYQDYCYFNVAYATKNPSYCKNIKNKEMTNSCNLYANQQNSETTPSKPQQIVQQEPNKEEVSIQQEEFKEKCILSTGLVCQDFKVHSSTIELTLVNQFGYPIQLHKIKVKNCENSINKKVEYNTPTTIIVLNCNNGNIGEIFYGDISYEYLTAIDQQTRNSLGVINAKIS